MRILKRKSSLSFPLQTSRLGWSKELSAPPKVDSNDFSHKKWALACANARNRTHFLFYKPPSKAGCVNLKTKRADPGRTGISPQLPNRYSGRAWARPNSEQNYRLFTASRAAMRPEFRAKQVNSTMEDLGSRKALEGAGPLAWYPCEVDTSIRPGWMVL